MQTAVEFATGPLKRNAQFTFRVFEFIIDTRAVRLLDAPLYSEAVRDLQSFCIHHLQRLAMRSSEDLVVMTKHSLDWIDTADLTNRLYTTTLEQRYSDIAMKLMQIRLTASDVPLYSSLLREWSLVSMHK